MYLKWFGLREEPFGVTPDPRFLWMGASHREAIASILHGLHTRRGFIAMVAPPGMGKTTVLADVLQRTSSFAHSAMLFQTQFSREELLPFVLRDLGLDFRSKDATELFERLNDFLLAIHRRGKQCILVVDEAQTLNDGVLEAIRLLSNFETPRQKLLQIVLSGQPQLADNLERPENQQLRQRISIICRLAPLGTAEVGDYIATRLRIAGRTEPLFTPDAVEAIAAESGGVPRNINTICFNMLSLACALGEVTVGADLLDEVKSDLTLHTPAAPEPVATPRRPAAIPFAVPRPQPAPAVQAATALRPAASQPVAVNASAPVPAIKPQPPQPYRAAAAVSRIDAPTSAATALCDEAEPAHVAPAPSYGPAPAAARSEPLDFPHLDYRVHAYSAAASAQADAVGTRLKLAAVVAVLLIVAAVYMLLDGISVPLPPPPESLVRMETSELRNAKLNRRGGAFVAGALIDKVVPAHPGAAATAAAEGEVSLLASIRADGTVRTVAVERGDKALAASAVAAVKQWRYTPSTLNGRPVPATVRITVAFGNAGR